MSKRLLLIDGNSIMFRAFFAMHQQMDRFVNHDGLHTAAVYGFKLMLDSVLKTYQPDAALVAFDAGKKTFRTAMYDDYKGGRDKTPSELSEQFPYVRQLLAASGIQTYELPNYEADDIIGTIAGQADAAGYTTTIVTGDRDLTQLVTEQTTVAVTKRGVTNTEEYTPAYMLEKLGVTPTQYIDVKALMGDSSDNYPGVTKIGEKTAVNLIREYGSLDAMYEQIDQMKPSKRKENLQNEEEIARQCQTLATIKRDAPITIGLADLAYTGADEGALVELYRELDFQSFLKQLNPTTVTAETPTTPYTELTAANLADVAAMTGSIVFHLELLQANYHEADLVGFVIGQPDHWYVSADVSLLQTPELKALLANPNVKKDVFNAKAQIVALNRLGVTLTPIAFDLLLASYLLDTNENSDDLALVAQAHDYQGVVSDEIIYGKGAKLAIPDTPATWMTHLANKAAAIHALRQPLFDELQANDQVALYTDIERPLSRVLAEMEMTGIRVEAKTLTAMQAELTTRLAELEAAIYEEAGEEFNINSPKQLGVILFEKLKLPVIKKTKTGYSTAVGVLEKLRPEAPIVDKILQYRQVAKIQSTYVAGLLKVIRSDHKIHTRYLQTLTQTGRLSSVEPNLQNIPTRFEEGRKIRQAFVPSEPDWVIFSSDYSQVELRILAHVSGDQNMQADFKSGEDIHASTARRIFHLLPGEEVTPNMRRQAKAVNFGIVYGISDYGLAQNINVTPKQAKEFIQNYFDEFPGVYHYTKDIVKIAREQGYVETLTHRRRYLPDIHAKNFNLRSFAERTAMNTPIQGSAADIIKIAMIKMGQALQAHGLQARMLLQIHDELVFEAPASEVPELRRVVAEVMDSAMQLDVPLKVESKVGPTWYDLKPIED